MIDHPKSMRAALKEDIAAIENVITEGGPIGEKLVSLIADANSQVWVDDDDSIIAFLSFGRSEIYALYVHPCRQGRCIGSKLLHHSERVIAAGGVTTVYVNVRNSSPKAQSFYTKHGYVLSGTTSNGEATQYWKNFGTEPTLQTGRLI
jgi:ribosomal protein S18 acetylase RimI-like enzyme